MQTIRLPSGETLPAFGIGTWNIGDSNSRRAEEIATIRQAIDQGVRLIDTAEMYGEGASELLVGEAIQGRRNEIFLVSKVYPHNATRRGTVAACERSLKRLGTDRLDLYLLHWRGGVPLEETLEALLALQAAGKIRHFGVSNFDADDMEEWCSLAGSEACTTNQVLYNLTRRGIEWDLLPWMRQRQMPLMAYSPIEQARLLRDEKLGTFARAHGITPTHAALGWLLAKDDVIVIPKSGRREHLRENLAVLERPLDTAEITELDSLFPKPSHPAPLAML